VSATDFIDYYELLQISPSAEPETIHRVYRLLAQRQHPDNQQTGNAERFRALTEAYHVLSDPARRAQYDLAAEAQRKDRWRLSAFVSNGDAAEDERVARLLVLEVLHANRRAKPGNPGISVLDLESLTGRAREHLEFTIWYLSQKKLVGRGDNSSLVITADGVDYLEDRLGGQPRRKLAAASAA
jgi:curved DNA-binding protein CbpA